MAHSRREFLETASAAAAALGQAACGAAQRPLEDAPTTTFTPAPSTDNFANGIADPPFSELALLALDADVRFQPVLNVSLRSGVQEIVRDDSMADTERGKPTVAPPSGDAISLSPISAMRSDV